jgi:hypothetical protein
VFVAVNERHSDPNWPAADDKKLEEVNLELRRRYPQIKDLKVGRKRLRELEEDEGDDVDEDDDEPEEPPKPQKNPQRKRERGKESRDNFESRDYTRFVMVYLSQAVGRLGKQGAQKNRISNLIIRNEFVGVLQRD